MNNSSKPLVAIRTIVYNHKPYLRDYFEGVIMQKTNFPFVAIVHDDCSTDGSTEIIKEYAEKYPDIIKPIYEEENQWSKHDGALIRIMKEAIAMTGAKYVAICEGDDYWINRDKLQRQVDFLENHSEYQLVCHNAIIHSEEHLWPDRIMCNFPTGELEVADIFRYWQMPNASILVRSNIYSHPVYLDITENLHGGLCLYVAAARIGKVYGIAECMSVYRKNAGGVSNGMSFDFVIDVNYKFAYAAKSEDAVRVIDNKVRKMLSDNYHAYLRGDIVARKAMTAAKRYNKYMAFLVFGDYILRLPQKFLKKLKKLIKESVNFR